LDAAGRPWRLFIALPLPGDVAMAVIEAVAPARARYPAARWISVSSLHVTLVFLGSTDPESVPAIVASIDAVASRHVAMDVQLGGGGGVQRRGDDGVAWLTLAQGGGETLRLAQELAETVVPLDVGDRRGPRRSPSAHVTVARHAPAALLRDPAFLHRPGPPIAWHADRVVLFRSLLERQGARYELLHGAPLRD
jgi:2'-5' RNA ligase